MVQLNVGSIGLDPGSLSKIGDLLNQSYPQEMGK